MTSNIKNKRMSMMQTGAGRRFGFSREVSGPLVQMRFDDSEEPMWVGVTLVQLDPFQAGDKIINKEHAGYCGVLTEKTNTLFLAGYGGVDPHSPDFMMVTPAPRRVTQHLSEQAWGQLSDIARACHQIAIYKGWWEDNKLTPVEISAQLALIHSEVSEALEEVRSGDLEMRIDDETHKPEGFPSELADVVIRVFDLCGGLGIDIADAVRKKMTYNETRTFRHGGKKL
jgi:NTP pyrophosphatase (non-canonical NTP hydrolase)